MFLAFFIFSLTSLFMPQLASASESLHFHNWQAEVLPVENSKKQCYIQLSGTSNENIFISMRLAVIEEKIPSKETITWTLIKVSAKRLHNDRPDRVSAIKIEEAWLATSVISSIGRIKKVDQGKASHFLGGIEGFRLFELLLKGIGKDGVTIGFRTKSEAKVTVVHAPPPSQGLFLKLYRC